MSKNTGDPAFPSHGDMGEVTHEGMTLRDYFAAKAMPAVYADYCASARQTGFDVGWVNFVAQEAYEMADAMIAEREKDND